VPEGGGDQLAGRFFFGEGDGDLRGDHPEDRFPLPGPPVELTQGHGAVVHFDESCVLSEAV
jgi:hypothetical protein